MARFDSPLENVRIASPCSARWKDMYGDERMRFCGECKLNVYNLSGMTKYDAENLFRLSEGRVCVRYYQRQDGTIMTKDCPVGWARVKERVSIVAAAVLSMVITIFGGLFLATSAMKKLPMKADLPRLLDADPPKGEPLMGAVAIPRKSPEADRKKPESNPGSSTHSPSRM